MRSKIEYCLILFLIIYLQGHFFSALSSNVNEYML